MTLSLGTAYRSFGGEMEASSTPMICRLLDSCRHQLSAIALLGALVALLGARRGSGTRSLSATSLNALYGHPLRRGKKFDVKHAFYCGQDRPNAVLYTSNLVSNFAVVAFMQLPFRSLDKISLR